MVFFGHLAWVDIIKTPENRKKLFGYSGAGPPAAGGDLGLGGFPLVLRKIGTRQGGQQKSPRLRDHRREAGTASGHLRNRSAGHSWPASYGNSSKVPKFWTRLPRSAWVVMANAFRAGRTMLRPTVTWWTPMAFPFFTCI